MQCIRIVVFRAAVLLVIVFATLVIGGGGDAVLTLPDLSAWHRFVPDAELKASDIGPVVTLGQ